MIIVMMPCHFKNNLQKDEKVQEIIKKSRGMPKRRLQHVYDMARTKSVCEGGDSADKNQDMMGDEETALKQSVCASHD